MMAIIPQIDAPFVGQVQADQLVQAVQITLEQFSNSDAAMVTLVITDSDTVQSLNRQYRNVDAPTDVLAFANPPDPDFPDLDRQHLGDVIIAYPVAQNQALARGHSPMEELILLAVHGTLHLLGFDHDTSVQKKKMWAAQEEVMVSLGLVHIQPSED
jgi:probable rRNA maturation factor